MHLLTPARIFVFSFLSLILVGTFLLALPFSSNGQPLALVDAFFTATSAVCVTGLTVFDPGQTLTLFGKIVLFFLFQLGGLGIVTFAVLFFELIGRNLSTMNRDVLTQSFLPKSRADLIRVIHWVVLVTLIIELIGTILLFLRFKDFFPLPDALGYAIFHAVSAFNNCGLSLFADSLTAFRGDLLVNSIVVLLIFLGGIGFYTLYEFWQKITKGRRFSLNTRLVLFSSLFLILFGTLFLFFFEYHNQLSSLSFKEKVLSATFQSVTARTCGFNTLNIGQLTNVSILVLMLLMFVGASPGSTGGGVKTTSFAIILLLVRSGLRGEENISVGNRSLSAENINKAITLVFAAISLIFISLSLLIFFADSQIKFASENRDVFLNYLFEVISAFSTVGLSMGVTADLNALQKLVLILTMFIGRVGPLTFVYSLHSRKKGLKYAEEKVMIG